MDLEFPNPFNSEQREENWPPGHDIGVFLSVGDGLTIVGTARGHSELTLLFRTLAQEWESLTDDADWFFTEDAR